MTTQIKGVTKAWGKRRNTRRNSLRGFTLIQLVTTLGLLALLTSIAVGVFSSSKGASQRVRCDMRIKAVVMALDAFRQETGTYPDSLNDLHTKRYVTDATLLRCPADPRPDGSYNDFYIVRAGRDSDELPILVCPLCENNSEQGLQAFKGRYTKQFATRPASLTSTSGATVERPGKDPIAARAGMQVRGGDTIRTAAGGAAILRFADGSTSEIGSNSEITVLQSFIAGNTHAPLYTLIRQKAGDIVYKVHHGSKFDVATPTATAGALGTEFRIREDANTGVWFLRVHESKVYCSNTSTTHTFTPLKSGSTDVTTISEGTPLTQTNQWVPIGEGEEVVEPNTPSSTPDSNTDSSKKKKWWWFFFW